MKVSVHFSYACHFSNGVPLVPAAPSVCLTLFALRPAHQNAFRKSFLAHLMHTCSLSIHSKSFAPDSVVWSGLFLNPVFLTQWKHIIERFHSRDYLPYWFTETKERICIKIEFNSQRLSLGHQHGCHFFVLGHQHGRCDVI